MSSKRPESSGDVGLTEAQREARKARRQKKRAERASEGLLSRNRPGWRGTVLTSSMGLAGEQGQPLG